MHNVDELFKDKNEVTFYVPIGVAEDKINGLIVELLDSIAAYISPLIDGLSKDDIYDYVTSPLYKNFGMVSFLQHKKYVTSEEEFIQLLVKYNNAANDYPYIKCYEVNMKLSSASAETIDEVALSQIIVSLLNDQQPTNLPPNINIKRTNYLIKLGKFSTVVAA